MYQSQSDLSSSEEVGVEGSELPRHDDFELFKIDQQDESPAVAAKTANADFALTKSSDAAEWSSGQLLAFLIAIALLVAALLWFFENIGERLERLRRRFKRSRNESSWDHDSMELVALPIAKGELTPWPMERTADHLEDDGDSVATLNRNAFPESEHVEASETFESEQDNRQTELHKEPAEDYLSNKDSHSLEDSHSASNLPAFESQNSEIAALKNELAGQATELETLTQALDEENSVTLQEAEARYQTLADELAASQLAQSQMQTDLATATQSLESLTVKHTQSEQEMETAYKELRGKEDSAGELESKLASSESLAQSLEEKLKLAQSDLENQVQQTHAAESRIEEVEKDALQSKQQLDELREKQDEGEVIDVGMIELLTKKLSTRTDEFDKLQNRFDETAVSADEKAALLEESEVRYKKLVEELDERKLSQSETQTKYQSELAAAQEEILVLGTKAEHAQKGLDTAYQEMLNKGDIATGLQEQNEEFEIDAATSRKPIDDSANGSQAGLGINRSTPSSTQGTRLSDTSSQNENLSRNSSPQRKKSLSFKSMRNRPIQSWLNT